MFWIVDNGFVRGTTFSFPQQYSTITTNYLADFGSFLRFTFGNLDLVKYFTPDGPQRTCKLPWNDELNCKKST